MSSQQQQQQQPVNTLDQSQLNTLIENIIDSAIPLSLSTNSNYNSSSFSNTTTSTSTTTTINSSTSPSISKDYHKLLSAIGDAQIVMLGESTHGTLEYYEQRAEITKLLIEKKGFNMIALEADWPDTYRLNRYIRSSKKGTSTDSTAKEAMRGFTRFPRWMWRNKVIEELIEWLKKRNTTIEQQNNGEVGIFGLDLYSLHASQQAVVDYLEIVDPEGAEIARERYAELDRFGDDSNAYGEAVSKGPLAHLAQEIQNKVLQTLVDLQRSAPMYLEGIGGFINGDEYFYVEQNAEVVVNAEEYYRKLFTESNVVTWNIRDQHMCETMLRIIQFHSQHYGIQPKVIIWAHNSHIGDATATEYVIHEEWSLGQLIRQTFGKENTFSIGFCTHSGTVTAATKWGDAPICYNLVPSLENTTDYIFHQVAEELEKRNKSRKKAFQLIFEDITGHSERDWSNMFGSQLQRAIGVVYKPESEMRSHYLQACISRQYNSIIFIDETHALFPLD